MAYVTVWSSWLFLPAGLQGAFNGTQEFRCFVESWCPGERRLGLLSRFGDSPEGKEHVCPVCEVHRRGSPTQRAIRFAQGL